MALMRPLISKLLALPMGVALLAMAACSGSAAVVTLTATPSSDNFVAYRVGLASVQLTKSGRKVGVVVLPAETTVDFTKLFDFSEVLGVPGVAKGTYTGALITLDYSAAKIIYDDGSLDGLELTPVDANGRALGLVSVGVTLDPGNSLISAGKQVGRLALDFDLAASSVVNLRARTITITPMISASTLPIDTKQVRIHGPILGSTSTFFATGVQPFDSTAAGLGQLSIEPSDVTTYEINGFVSTGTAGQAQLAALPANTLAETFGTLSISTAGTTTATSTLYASPTSAGTAASVSFAATQVLVDSSVQGLGIDVLSGVVSARSGNTLGIEDATLNQNGGTVTFLPGTTIVNVGPNTLITAFGQGVAAAISPQEISVGSSIEAFGTATQTTATQTSTAAGTSGVVFDASTGRVRLDLTTAQGLVTAQGAAALMLNLTSLGGRSISAFDFNGSGAAPNQYGVAAQQGLDLTNAIVGAPVVVTGFPSAFGSASPNFTASTLLDPTTIQAELVVDWNGGTAAPFTASDTTSITFNVNNSSIGTRHQIQIGSQIVDIVGLSSGLTIAPTTGSEMVFSIGHSSSFTIESFDTYTAFITQLQSELNGALATGMTAVGQYTVSTSAFSASSITLFLNN